HPALGRCALGRAADADGRRAATVTAFLPLGSGSQLRRGGPGSGLPSGSSLQLHQGGPGSGLPFGSSLQLQQGGPGSGSGTPSRAPGAREGGFTLIEVLLAIALVSIIMAMAYGGFRASVRATSSGEAVIEQTNRLRVVQQFMRRQLMQARALIIEEFE